MVKADSPIKDRTISIRLSGDNLSLFEQLKVSPTELVQYALNKAHEENLNSEKLTLLTNIKTLKREITNSEIQLKAKKESLKKLEQEMANHEQKSKYFLNNYTGGIQ